MHTYYVINSPASVIVGGQLRRIFHGEVNTRSDVVDEYTLAAVDTDEWP